MTISRSDNFEYILSVRSSILSMVIKEASLLFFPHEWSVLQKKKVCPKNAFMSSVAVENLLQ